MKRTLLTLAAATALTAAIPAIASAQTINDRQANLFSRIDAGVRSGQLTRGEADRLRADFNSLARLEADYRSSYPGLTNAERNDLNRRFDALSSRIRFDRNDNDRRGGWQSVSARLNELTNRIERAFRRGDLSQYDRNRLRGDSQTIARLETQYRRSGNVLTVAERNDLDRRLDRLQRDLQYERRDNNQYGYGYGNNSGYGWNR